MFNFFKKKKPKREVIMLPSSVDLTVCLVEDEGALSECLGISADRKTEIQNSITDLYNKNSKLSCILCEFSKVVKHPNELVFGAFLLGYNECIFSAANKIIIKPAS